LQSAADRRQFDRLLGEMAEFSRYVMTSMADRMRRMNDNLRAAQTIDGVNARVIANTSLSIEETALRPAPCSESVFIEMSTPFCLSLRLRCRKPAQSELEFSPTPSPARPALVRYPSAGAVEVHVMLGLMPSRAARVAASNAASGRGGGSASATAAMHVAHGARVAGYSLLDLTCFVQVRTARAFCDERR
jgi:hypothetical protein